MDRIGYNHIPQNTFGVIASRFIVPEGSRLGLVRGALLPGKAAVLVSLRVKAERGFRIV